MQICQSFIGGKPLKSNLPIIEKRYPATGEVIAHIEPASDAMLAHHSSGTHDRDFHKMS